MLYEKNIENESNSSILTTVEGMVCEEEKSDSEEEIFSDEIEILKKILILERKKRIEQNIKFHKFIKATRVLKLEYDARLREKENQIKRINWENTSSKVENNISSMTPKKSKQRGFFTKEKTSDLDNELNFILLDYEKQKEKVKTIQHDYEEEKIINESQYKSIQKKDELIRRQEIEKEENEIKMKVLDSENKKLLGLKNEISENNRKLEINLKAEKLNNERLIKENLELRHTLEKERKEKLSTFTKKEEIISQLTSKLIDLKNQLQIINLQLSEYDVIRIGKRGKEEAKIVVQKNPKHKNISLDIVVRKEGRKELWKHNVVPLDCVSHVYFSKEAKNRFCIKYNEKVDTFESPLREEIVTKLRGFLQYIQS